jgi:hypothetical protein
MNKDEIYEMLSREFEKLTTEWDLEPEQETDLDAVLTRLSETLAEAGE